MKKLRKTLSASLIAVFLFSIIGFNAISVHASVTGQAIVTYARTFIGVPYVWGGSSPSGFDCSGLVMYVYGNFGISLPHYTGDQVKYGTTVTGDLKPGDLLFFGSTSDPNHVAIYSGNGEMIEAPRTGLNVREVPIRSYSIAKRLVASINVSPFAQSVNSNSIPLLKDCVITQSGVPLCSLPDSSTATRSTLPQGASAKVYAQNNGWYLINCGTPQWIPAQYVKQRNQLQPTATATVITSVGVCRENPDSNELDTGNLSYGRTVNIYEGYRHFYLVNASQSLQWMDIDTVKITSMPNIPTADSSSQPISTYSAPAGTKFYQFPMTNINNINGSIATSKTVNVYAEYGNWYLVNNVVPQWIQHN